MFKTLFTLLAPQLAIPMKIISSIFSWRPSFFEITTIVAVLLFAGDEVRINGFHIKPHIGPIHFTLLDIQGFKEEVTDLNDQLATRKTDEAIARQAQIITNEAPHTGTQAIAENLDVQAPIISQKVDAALKDYINSHPVSQCNSVRQSTTTGQPSGTTGLLADTGTSSGSSQASVAPGLVAIPASDLQHWVDNTKALDELLAYLAATTKEGWTVIPKSVTPPPEPAPTPSN